MDIKQDVIFNGRLKTMKEKAGSAQEESYNDSQRSIKRHQLQFNSKAILISVFFSKNSDCVPILCMFGNCGFGLRESEITFLKPLCCHRHFIFVILVNFYNNS